jgi:hypothetical protein
MSLLWPEGQVDKEIEGKKPVDKRDALRLAEALGTWALWESFWMKQRWPQLHTSP